MSNNQTIPTKITAEEAEEITQALQKARHQLRDAAGSRIYEPNYLSTSSKIAALLEKLGVQDD